MRTVRYHRHGGPEVLTLEDAPEPDPAAGEVVVRPEAIGANVIDVVLRRGDGAWKGALPGTLSGEVVGPVVAVGPGVTDVAPGDRVAALATDAFADLVVADAAWLAPVPDGLDVGAATYLAMNAPLALRLLRHADLAAGERVLVTSAAGGVGHLLVQFARRLGAGTVVGTASSPAKRQAVLDLGADAAVDSTAPDWPDRVREVAPDGVDVVLDSVGGATFLAGLDLLAPLGRLVTYGAVGGRIADAPGRALLGLRRVAGFGLLGWRAARPEQARADLTEAAALLAGGSVRAAVHARLPLAEVRRVHEILEARENVGRLVVVPGEG